MGVTGVTPSRTTRTFAHKSFPSHCSYLVLPTHRPYYLRDQQKFLFRFHHQFHVCPNTTQTPTHNLMSTASLRTPRDQHSIGHPSHHNFIPPTTPKSLRHMNTDPMGFNFRSRTSSPARYPPTLAALLDTPFLDQVFSPSGPKHFVLSPI